MWHASHQYEPGQLETGNAYSVDCRSLLLPIPVLGLRVRMGRMSILVSCPFLCACNFNNVSNPVPLYRALKTRRAKPLKKNESIENVRLHNCCVVNPQKDGLYTMYFLFDDDHRQAHGAEVNETWHDAIISLA
jgi:hypothetical protein